MSNYSVDNDVILHIYYSGSKDLSIGFQSRYTDVKHPGSGKLVQGWQWDKKVWPTDRELNATESAPVVWDPVSSWLTYDYWQSGIGDNNDLLLLSVEDSVVENDELWIPKIHHGHFYDRNTEWYLFSDDLRLEHFYHNQTQSGVQYINLDYKPKPGVPVNVRRYVFDKTKREYEIDINLRKKVEFTGEDDADTLNDDGTIAFHNMASGQEEFVVDYDYSATPRIFVDQGYQDIIAASGEFDSYELVGVSDGTQEVYNFRYSPVDPSGQVEIMSYVSSGAYTWWNKIDSNQVFNEPVGEAEWPYECKVDDMLGVVAFWSGCMPEAGSKVISRYTSGLVVEYEPEKSRDFTAAYDADTNPIHNPFDAGFVLATMNDTEPASIILEASYETGSDYQTEVGGSVGNLVATVKDIEGRVIEGVNVGFEILDPSVGSANLDNSLTDASGQAKVIYSPPANFESVGRFTQDVTVSGDYNIYEIANLFEPTSPSGVLIYAVYDNDDSIGIPASGLDDYYTDYITDEEFEVTPMGVSTSLQSGLDFEKDYRDMFGLEEPVTFDDTLSSNTGTGRKVLLYDSDSGVISPHFGIEQNGLIPSSQTSGTSEDLNEVTYGAGLWVAVGNNDTILTSLDGKVWTARTSGTSGEDFDGIHFANGIFVAGGDSGIILTSSNGIDWSESAGAGDRSGIFDVAYGSGLWIASSFSGEVYKSSDSGISWSSDNVGIAQDCLCITYGNGVWVVGSQEGNLSVSSDGGSSWTPKSAPVEQDYYDGIYADGFFLLVGIGSIITSSDGDSWDSATVAGYGFKGIDYGSGLFVTSANSNVIMSSPDGTGNWTVLTGVNGSVNLHGVGHNDGNYVVVGTGGTIYFISIDFINSPIWPIHHQNIGTSDNPILQLIYASDGEDPFAGDVRSFFIAVEGGDRARAYITNNKTRKKTYSNTINLDTNVPEKSDGVFFFTSSADIPTNLFNRPYDVNALPDATIIATSGELWDYYLNERLPTTIKEYKELTITDPPSRVLYRFDGDYTDASPSGVDGTDYGTSFITTNAFNTQSLSVAVSSDCVMASGLVPEYLDMNKGTLELHYKTPYADYQLGSGSNAEYLNYLVGQSSTTLEDGTSPIGYDGIIIRAEKIGVTPYVFFDWMASGQTAGIASQRAYRLDSTNLTDGYWHQIKMSWDFSPDDVVLNSGQLDLDVWVDNISIINSDNIPFNNIPQTITSGLEYVAGFAASGIGAEVVDLGGNFSALGYYDEIRLSSGEQTDYTFQPDYGLTYEDYVTWFRRTRKLDTRSVDLDGYTFSGVAPNMTPIGYRLKDDNSEIASVLDQRVFLDLNDPLPSGLYEVG